MFTDPKKNLKQLGLRETMIVADLGAGNGFYSIEAAKMVPFGKVYAIEIVKDFLNAIRNKAKELKLNNLECIWGDVEAIDGTHLKDGIVDMVIASNIFSQVENKIKFINEIKRILKPQGKVLLIDWSTSFPQNSSLNKKVSREEVREFFEKKGFIFKKEIDAEESHYGIIFERDER